MSGGATNREELLRAEGAHLVFDGEALDILDQRQLPQTERRLVLRDVAGVVEAIRTMAVRGAPALGITAAYACVLAAREAKNGGELDGLLRALASARPTAVNPAWAVERMRALWRKYDGLAPADLAPFFLELARKLHAADILACMAIGAHGQRLLADGDSVLTHCNAGALATGGFGTALGVIRAAFEAGKRVSVLADETRPLLQGARLTAWELRARDIPVTLVCDNACALLMARGRVQKVVVGADRIAANGDTANKIGTLGVAVLAAHFKIPFYVAAPLSTIDRKISNGAGIPIEERPAGEVRFVGGREMAPAGVAAVNFAFDVTPAALIAGIITECGVLYAPFEDALARACGEGGA